MTLEGDVFTWTAAPENRGCGSFTFAGVSVSALFYQVLAYAN